MQVQYPVFAVTGTTEEELLAADRATRQRIAFYGSTPAYRPVLELHGWESCRASSALSPGEGSGRRWAGRSATRCSMRSRCGEPRGDSPSGRSNDSRAWWTGSASTFPTRRGMRRGKILSALRGAYAGTSAVGTATGTGSAAVTLGP